MRGLQGLLLLLVVLVTQSSGQSCQCQRVGLFFCSPIQPAPIGCSCKLKVIVEIEVQDNEFVAPLKTVCEARQDNTGILFIGYGQVIQSFSCNISLPIDLGNFFKGGVTAVNETIYIYNSANNKCSSGNLESPDSWRVKTSCLSPRRFYSTLTAVGSYILATGGYDTQNFSDQIDRFDGRNGEILTNKLTSPRSQHCAVAISNTEMIVLGGGGGGKYLSTVEKYDIDGNVIVLKNMAIERNALGCIIFDKELYAAGGNNKRGVLSDVEVYNFDRNEWRTIKSMNLNRRFPALHVYNGKLTVFGGNSSSIEVFDGTNWELSNDTLKENFDQGVSVSVKCPV